MADLGIQVDHVVHAGPEIRCRAALVQAIVAHRQQAYVLEVLMRPAVGAAQFPNGDKVEIALIARFRLAIPAKDTPCGAELGHYPVSCLGTIQQPAHLSQRRTRLAGKILSLA